MGRLCKLFGHRRGFLDDPYRPYDIIIGCTRCADPALQITVVHGEPDPRNPGIVKVTGLERLRDLLEGVRAG
jgi:hypothetical protein